MSFIYPFPTQNVVILPWQDRRLFLFWIAHLFIAIDLISALASTYPNEPICKLEVGKFSIPPEKMTPRTFHFAFLPSIGNNGNDKLIGGAFFYALEQLEQEARNKSIPVNFTWSFNDTKNLENKAARIMADLYCHSRVSAFIGPEGHCRSAGLMATAFNIPYMTYGCHDNHNETSLHRMINTDPSIAYVSKFITAVLSYFQWSSFWLVSGTDLNWEYTSKQLKMHTETMNITLNGETLDRANNMFNPMFYKTNPYVNVIKSSKQLTRVYVFLGDYDSLIIFLRQMTKEGLTDTGKYVVVAADSRDKPDYKTFYLNIMESDNAESQAISETEIKRYAGAFKNVLLVGASNQDRDMKEFEAEVYERSKKDPINFATPPFANFETPEMPKTVYHLYDATYIFGHSVMSLMGVNGSNPEDASEVIQYIKGRRHCSIQGSTLLIHANGETEDSYEVRGMVQYEGSTNFSFDIIGSFDTNSNPAYYKEAVSFWSKGNIPVSNPKCGFHGENCVKSQTIADWAIGIMVAVGVIVLIITIAQGISCYRRHQHEKKLDSLLWKIEMHEIEFMNASEIHEIATPKQVKKKDSLANMFPSWMMSDSPDTCALTTSEQKYHPLDQPVVGMYKGCNIFMKQLTRKHLELTRDLKVQFQLRKELTHENINRFIGACIDPPVVSIVTEYCTRKSLQDILADDALPHVQQDLFITELVHDLINGMTFIHESEFGYHGNLKSSNCLVDRRWTLKITDFGFSCMGPSPPAMPDDAAAFDKMLWTAPEFLQRRFTSSSSYISQNQSSISQNIRPSRIFSSLHQHGTSGKNAKPYSIANVHGQQKGDVYSFAIILYELYGQAGPWGHINCTSREIIEKLLSPGFDEPFRPDTSSLKQDPSIITLMQSCWSNDPDSRPDFKYTVRVRFKPKKKGCLMELYADDLESMVADRTEELRKEKKMTENLLLRMLPKPVADRLMRSQPVQPEQFECVTIYFSDIVGFTELSAESTPMEVVNLLNDLYTLFDSVIHKFSVYKVETIGDAYMVVSGLPYSIGDSHAGEIASMSLLFLQKLLEKRFTVRGQTDYILKLRIGIHSGPCCAGVVGLKMPRYCLFGDTVNTANRMESTGEPLKIHCSAACKEILDKLGGYHLQKRGHTEVKGKGQLLTYFLISEDEYIRRLRRCTMSYTERCVSASNLDYSGTPMNRRSAPQPTLLPALSPHQNGLRSSSISLPHSGVISFRGLKANVVPMSLNSSMDSSTSALLDHNDSIDDSNSISDFRTNTLPKPSITRQNSLGCKNMSPIAEDPWTPNSGFALKDKSFNFHDVGSSDNDSECDTLLKRFPGNLVRTNSLNYENNVEYSPTIRSVTKPTHTPETIL